VYKKSLINKNAIRSIEKKQRLLQGKALYDLIGGKEPTKGKLN